MKVWELSPDALDYCEYGFPEEEDRTQFKQIQESHLWRGRMVGSAWLPPILLRNIQRKDGAFGYFMDFHVLFSQEAMAIFKPLLSGDVEWLPVLNDQRGLYYMNALAQVDCIDYDRSKFKRAEISGKITAVQRFEFLPERIGDRLVFKIPVFGLGHHVMVTDRFQAVCEENQLSGLDFSTDNLLWSSTKLTS
ncbi:MAG: hypothetical protein RLZZ165_2485 [Bacteroidota bacterium]|jgi:hypothetical protein